MAFLHTCRGLFPADTITLTTISEMTQTDYVSVVGDFDFDADKLIEEYGTFEKEFRNSFFDQGCCTKFHLVRFGKPCLKHYSNGLPYTLEILERVKSLFNFDVATYRVIKSKRRNAWHIDYYKANHSYHIPLITNSECRFLYDEEDESLQYKLPVGYLYKTKTDITHNFQNNGLEDRVHITFENQFGFGGINKLPAGLSFI